MPLTTDDPNRIPPELFAKIIRNRPVLVIEPDFKWLGEHPTGMTFVTKTEDIYIDHFYSAGWLIYPQNTEDQILLLTKFEQSILLGRHVASMAFPTEPVFKWSRLVLTSEGFLEIFLRLIGDKNHPPKSAQGLIHFHEFEKEIYFENDFEYVNAVLYLHARSWRLKSNISEYIYDEDVKTGSVTTLNKIVQATLDDENLTWEIDDKKYKIVQVVE